jgi:hypothetical protein
MMIDGVLNRRLRLSQAKLRSIIQVSQCLLIPPSLRFPPSGHRQTLYAYGANSAYGFHPEVLVYANDSLSVFLHNCICFSGDRSQR